MKHLLWFLHKPADERERSLYYHAYSRVLSFMSGALVIGLIVFSLADIGLSIPGFVLKAILWIVAIGSIFAGWSVLKKEDLDAIPRVQVGGKKIFLTVAIIELIFMFVVFLSPSLFVLSGIITLFVMHIALTVFAWKYLKDALLPFRILLSVLFPVFALTLISSKETSEIKRSIKAIAETLIIYMVFGFSMFFVMALLRGGVVTPVYINSDFFAPTLHKGEVVYADAREKNTYPGDYIFFIGEDGRPRIGKQTEYNEDHIVAETASGTMQIGYDDLRGKIMLENKTIKTINNLLLFKQFNIKVLSQ